VGSSPIPGTSKTILLKGWSFFYNNSPSALRAFPPKGEKRYVGRLVCCKRAISSKKPNSFLKLSTLKAQRDVWVIISKTQIPKKTKDQHQPTTH
tara:strand:+ start:78994 stop:79275 length:282 start_codon:yes stop_codon:yes gene_type:complete